MIDPYIGPAAAGAIIQVFEEFDLHEFTDISTKEFLNKDDRNDDIILNDLPNDENNDEEEESEMEKKMRGKILETVVLILVVILLII